MTAPYTPNLEALLALLSGGARIPADATFTTAKGEGDLAKARRKALAELHPPTLAEKLSSALSGLGMTVQGPNSNIRESAPRYVELYSNEKPAYFGNNGNVIGGRASDSTALQNMQKPLYNARGTPQEIATTAADSNRSKFSRYEEIPYFFGGDDSPLAEQIARLKALRARNSNNPG